LRKDGTNASKNDAESIDGWNEKVDPYMGNTHTHIRWFPAHLSLFHCEESKKIAGTTKRKKKRGGKKQPPGTQTSKSSNSLGKMYSDLKKYRTFPLVGLVKQAQRLMLRRWKAPASRGGYGEKEITKAWKKSWADEKMTRIERNHDHVLKGGLPCDNNTTERLNRGDKKVLAEIAGPSRATSLEGFLSALLERVTRLSCTDLSFCGQLKQVVRSTRFHGRVDQIVNCLLYTSPCPLDRTRSRMPSSA